jgi:hypothetical protein
MNLINRTPEFVLPAKWIGGILRPREHGVDRSQRRMRHSLLSRIRCWLIVVACCLQAIAFDRAESQTNTLRVSADPGAAAIRLEEYLRYRQILGRTPAYPWSIRGFTASQLRVVGEGDPSVEAWSEAFPPGGLSFEIFPVRSRVTLNSAFPYGWNDGPVWKGKGLTSEISWGGMARIGPLSLVLAPIAFRAENGNFPLVPNGLPIERRFVDPWEPNTIDRPQRFGDDAYARVDLGQSSLTLEVSGVTAGLSTATETWGPASEHPILLSANAPGFFHGFLGTSRPVGVGIGTLHARALWGRLEESGFWDEPEPTAEWRFISGFVVTFSPRGLTGLEVGMARVFHTLLEGGIGSGEIFQPFEGLLKGALPEGIALDSVTNSQNQIASAFARWVFAPAGVEIYGEYGREDHNWDLRDFLLEPDQQRAYTVGFRKAWDRGGESFLAFRAELANGQVSTIKQFRPQSPFYRHTVVRQGHTNRGQVIGSAALFTGGGSVAAVDFYSGTDRWTLSWTRFLGDPGKPDLAIDADVQHALGGEAVLVRRGIEFTTGMNAVYHFNRNLEDDQFNLNTYLEARIPLLDRE